MEMKPGYKQTEVGVIPQDWELVPMGLLGTFTKGQGIRKAEAASGDIPCVRYGEIYTHHNDIIRSYNSWISAEVARTSKRLKQGDLLFAGSGETKEEIGKCVAYVGREETYAGGDIVILSPNNGSSDFLGYLFNTPVIARQKASKGQGDAVVHISASALSSIRVPLPPTRAEQEAIAEALSDADALIESLEQLLVKKRRLKQGAMQQLLTGKKRLPGFDMKRGYKQTEVGVIPEDWGTPELGGVLKSMQLGGNYKNSGRETSWPLIKMGNLGRGSIKLEKLEFIDLSQPPASRDRLRKDDVLFNTRNTLDLVGKVAIWRDELPEAYFNSNIMRMDFDEMTVSSSRCMNYILNTAQSLTRLYGIAIGTTSVAAIYSRDLVKVRIPLPTKAEQEAIAAALGDMDAEIAALEAKLAKTRHLKQGMMQELLTGRIRLV